MWKGGHPLDRTILAWWRTSFVPISICRPSRAWRNESGWLQGRCLQIPGANSLMVLTHLIWGGQQQAYMINGPECAWTQIHCCSMSMTRTSTLSVASMSFKTYYRHWYSHLMIIGRLNSSVAWWYKPWAGKAPRDASFRGFFTVVLSHQEKCNTCRGPKDLHPPWISRCISYWKWWFSNVMLVNFQGCTSPQVYPPGCNRHHQDDVRHSFFVRNPYPDTQCMVCLPTFTLKINQM